MADKHSWFKKLFSDEKSENKSDNDKINLVMEKSDELIEESEITCQPEINGPKKMLRANDKIEVENGKEKLKKKIKVNLKDKKEKIKGKIEKAKNDDEPSQFDELKGIFDHVIEPEERTFKNYVNPGFWIGKRNQYKSFREKERQDLNIYEILSRGAMPTIEYYFLTVLSCIISTFGLIQGAAATIIGAMIVAPLMTPILAFSLGVVWGDIALIKRSFMSILKGVFLGILISTIIAFIIPMPSYSNEIMSRTNPTLFDILVAMASGIVGAYGYADKKISNTLIGIAIAVALMPPLCNIGIGIGTLNFHIAFGSGILFLINLVSIGLAGAIVFWWMKIHPALADEDDVKKRALSQIVISVIVLLIISVPVGIFMYRGYVESEVEINIRETFEQQFTGQSIFDLRFRKYEDKNIFDIILMGESMPHSDKVSETKKDLLKKHPFISNINIRYIKSIRIIKPVIE